MAEVTSRWLLVTIVLLFVLMVAFFVFLAYTLGPEARLDTVSSAEVLLGTRGVGLRAA